MATGFATFVAVPVFFGYMLLLWDDDNQTVFDRLAGTYVVEDAPQQQGRWVGLFSRLEHFLLLLVATIALAFFAFLFAWSALK